MFHMKHSSISNVLALAIALTLPAAAIAQTTAPQAAPSQTAPSQTAPSSRPGPRASTEATMTERVQRRIDQLHAQLQITPAQDTQWTQFAQVMQQNAQNMHDALDQRGAQFNSMNAAQDMQSYAHLAQVHAEGMQRLSAAFQTLYDSMSPAQQQNADNVFRNRPHGAAANRRRPAPG